MAIDVGAPAIDRAANWQSDTMVEYTNPANATGTIDHIEAYAISDVIDVGAFYETNGGVLSTRGYVEGLSVSPGYNEWDAPGDFTAFDINEGDCIGCYVDFMLDFDFSGGIGTRSILGDYVPCTETSFDWDADLIISLYATGTEAVEGYTIVIGSGAFVEAGQIVGVLHDKKIWVGEHWG